jgi:hypothetical protein
MAEEALVVLVLLEPRRWSVGGGGSDLLVFVGNGVR